MEKDWQAKDFPADMYVGDDYITKTTEKVADGTQQDTANADR